MNPALCDAGSRIHKISSKVIGDWGGGGATLRLCHNGLCFSFVVVLYSMYSLYAIIKVVLLNERDCHVSQQLEA